MDRQSPRHKGKILDSEVSVDQILQRTLQKFFIMLVPSFYVSYLNLKEETVGAAFRQ